MLETKRRVGIEYLRILSMLMIVAHHFACHGGFLFDSVNQNSILVKVLELGGKTGVNIFVLISGYFCRNTNFHRKKFLKLILLTSFYSIVISIVCVLIGIIPLRKKLLLTALFPYLFGGGYWFVVIYLIMYCLIPFIQGGLADVRNTYVNSILIGAVFLYVLTPAIMGNYIKTNDFGLSNLVWFIVLYILGGQLREYEDAIASK